MTLKNIHYHPNMNQKRTGAGCGEGVRRKQRASREQGRLLPIQQPVSEQGKSEPMVCKTIVLSTQTPSLVGGKQTPKL